MPPRHEPRRFLGVATVDAHPERPADGDAVRLAHSSLVVRPRVDPDRDEDEQVAGRLDDAVGDCVQHPLRDPELRGSSITVTSVDASPDLRNAIAFVMPLGGADAQRLLAALRRAAPWFRARVGERAQLRHAPEIRFEIDRTFDDADRISALLRRPDVARDIEDPDIKDD